MDDNQIKQILSGMRRVAIVGISPKADRPSHGIARWLKGLGIDIAGVSPAHQDILGLTVVPDLADVPDPVDIVIVFRRSDMVEPVVATAIARGDRAIWLQEGISNEAAAAAAHQAGIPMIMDRCIYKEWLRLLND